MANDAAPERSKPSQTRARRLWRMCLPSLVCCIVLACLMAAAVSGLLPFPLRSEVLAVISSVIADLSSLCLLIGRIEGVFLPIGLATVVVLWLLRFAGRVFPRATRVCSQVFLCWLLVFLASGVYLCVVEPAAKDAACYWLARYQRPLIGALEAYRTEHGSYPETLDALTPPYVSRPPMTGLVGFTEFEYTSSGADFDLEIPCGSPLNMDDSSYFGYKHDGSWKWVGFTMTCGPPNPE